MNYIILDLDNTIANDEWRIQHIDWTKEKPQERYHNYHMLSSFDSVGNRDLFERTPYKIIVLTARPVMYKELTMCWLKHIAGINPACLFMRGMSCELHSKELKRSQLHELFALGITPNQIVCAYDDRQDVVDMYRENKVHAVVRKIHDTCAYTKPIPAIAPEDEGPKQILKANWQTLKQTTKEKTAADILQEMADTFKERNAIYGDNYKMVAKLVAVLFPNGVPSELILTDQWHLFELLIVKMSRFAISNLTHQDSIHDASVYGAMIEAIIFNQRKA